MKRFSSTFVLLLLALLPTAALADTATVGDLEFNSYSTGFNDFTVNNFTGTNNLMGAFPVADDVSFDNIVLTATESDSTVVTFNLGDLAPVPGTAVSPTFSSSINFTQVVITATLIPSTFTLTDSTTFMANPSLTFTLTPTTSGQTIAPPGPYLVAGQDFGVLNAVSLSPTPEPSTFILSAFGLLGIFTMIRARKFLYFHRS